MKLPIKILLLFILLLAPLGMASAQVVVTSGGVDPTENSTDWISAGGYAQFSGNVSGVNWNNGGAREGTDWTYGYGSGSTTSSVMTQWGTGAITSLAQDSTGLGNGGGDGHGSELYVDSGMLTDLNGANLTISEVAPAAGTFTLNGVSDTATAGGQILRWYATNSTLSAEVAAGGGDNVLVFDNTSGGYTGPIGFSAETVPEPAIYALMACGLAGLVLCNYRHLRI